MKLHAAALASITLACGAPQVNSTPMDGATDASKASTAADCGVSAESAEAYVPAPAWSGKPVDIPDAPAMPTTPLHVDDAYTVYGATHDLTSIVHARDLSRGSISIVGYIVATNLAAAPACALHHTGHADPEGCRAPIPSFTIADQKADTSGRTIRVMGWASNFANVYEANQRYKKLTAPPAKLYTDTIWASTVPYPLPSVGAKVKVTGRYGVAFTRASSGFVTDEENGILTLDDVRYLEPAPEPAKFPQLAK